MGTSFYGNSVIGSGSGEGGTTNYNELSNKPIINLNGLTPINLSTLVPGLYNIQGNYVYDENDQEIKKWLSSIFVQVYLDAVTGDKIVTYDVYENNKHLTYSIDYLSDGIYKVDKYTYEIINTSAGTTEELPEIGDITQIYSTEEGLFVWNEEVKDYVQLGTSQKAEAEQTWDQM